MWIKFKVWLCKRMFTQYGPIMINHRDYYIYMDPTGKIWEVKPTGDYNYPLRISLLSQN